MAFLDQLMSHPLEVVMRALAEQLVVVQGTLLAQGHPWAEMEPPATLASDQVGVASCLKIRADAIAKETQHAET